MNHIVVIGFMGSGKTRVGKRLSSDLGLTFVDVDKVIVKKMNMSVKEILQKFGEPYYRALETMTVKALIEDKERKVIELANEAGDDVTADLMTSYLKEQEKMVWMLVAFSTKSCTK